MTDLSPEASQRAVRWRDRVIAVFVLAHVSAITLMSSPRPTSASTMRTPQTQQTLRTAVSGLEVLGVSATPEEVGDAFLSLSNAYRDVRTPALRAFTTYGRWTGARQSWAMFSTITRTGARYEVLLEEEGEWRPIYVARSPDYTWRRTLFDEERVRTVIATHGRGKRRDIKDARQFSTWVAALAARDFPEATRIRTRYQTAPLPSPEEVRGDRVPAPVPRRVHTVELGPLR